MTARDRIVAPITRYGADTVKGVMKKIIDDGERASESLRAAGWHLARPNVHGMLPAGDRSA